MGLARCMCIVLFARSFAPTGGSTESHCPPSTSFRKHSTFILATPFAMLKPNVCSVARITCSAIADARGA
eukprot:4237040-Pyramimonas_sp.AAC.1